MKLYQSRVPIFNRSKVFFSFVCVLLGGVACGKSPPSGFLTPPKAPVINPPLVSPATCQAQGGAGVTVNGQPLCKIVIHLPSVSLAYTGSLFPIVTPLLPIGQSAYDVGVQVRKNDHVYFTGTSFWGATQVNSSSYLGGLFNFTTMSTNCQLINGSGLKTDGTVATVNQGLPPGLMASEGLHSYFLGNSASVLILNDGELRLGFNVPLSYSNLNCGNFLIQELRIERCMNSAGALVSCS